MDYLPICFATSSAKFFFFFLLNSVSGLVTNEAFDCDLSAVFFSNLCYVVSNGLFSVFCFYVNLVKKADLFKLFS